ncbi:cell surface protein [Streptomyces sp. RPA4-5]|uniref:IPT/TIG domain-containing protein n=1 Tax=Streptomyces TaxID=1883 RepID=UPI00143E13F3|nr:MULTISPECIES: IPT/TIG domain-containing protein [Streptomyces]MCX4638206.1 IPT/TIG domain-containing protein [Streptomyces platensis]QIY54579.1 cell surface protein [Streptomyces sp. RPA4-5]WJY37224.1 IPT/TIG domain-containing protein [Streptomyces sp. P9-2B-2]
MPISPNQGSTGGGFAATLTGTGLTGATVVRFGSKPATITATSPTSVSVVAPSGAGVVDTTVTTPGGTSNPVPFYYVLPPVILDVSPASGPLAGGSTVTVTGRNLTTATSVLFGSTAVTPTVLSDSELTAVSPAHAAGEVALVVTAQGGTATASGTFGFVAAPNVTGFSPVTGLPAGGTLVDITGTALATTTQVTFGSVPATFAVLSDTRVAAVAPSHAAGTVTITLTTTGGSDAAPGVFLYLL